MELLLGSPTLLSEKSQEKVTHFPVKYYHSRALGVTGTLESPMTWKSLYPKQLAHFPTCNHYKENDHG